MSSITVAKVQNDTQHCIQILYHFSSYTLRTQSQKAHQRTAVGEGQHESSC